MPTESISPFTTEQLAHHEAGHAVMSLVLGTPWEFVTITKAGKFEGLVDPGEEFRYLEGLALKGNHHFAYDHILALRNYIRVIYAGPMAEGLFLKDPEWWRRALTGNDSDHAYSLLEGIYKHEPEIRDMSEELMDETMKKISQDDIWENIRIIANALIEKNRLTREECTTLLESKK